MNSIDFCFWLQGHFEIGGSDTLSEKQVEIIKNHLSLVFKHEIDPAREGETTATPQELNSSHTGSNPPFGPSHGLNDIKVRC